jgi:hypothetical protein
MKENTPGHSLSRADFWLKTTADLSEVPANSGIEVFITYNASVVVILLVNLLRFSAFKVVFMYTYISYPRSNSFDLPSRTACWCIQNST